MRFSCPCCNTEYAVPPRNIPRGYYKVVCSHCGYKWRKAVGVNLTFPLHKIALEMTPNAILGQHPARPEYRPEVLAILREEATEELRLRRS